VTQFTEKTLHYRGDRFVPIDLAKEKMSVVLRVPVDSAATESVIPKDVAAIEKQSDNGKSKTTLSISPNLQLNIQIHIAADTPEDKIEAIFRNMRVYLLNNAE
jgi:hypothetical protein